MVGFVDKQSNFGGGKLHFEEATEPDKNEAHLRQRYKLRSKSDQSKVKLKFEHGDVKNRSARSKFRFEGNRTKSKLRFEADSVKGRPSESSEAAPDSEEGYSPKRKRTAAKGAKGKRVLAGAAGAVSSGISEVADSSENDSVRAADKGRVFAGHGAKYGWRYRKYRKQTAPRRLDKRAAKATAKEKMREFNDKQYFEKHGKQSPRQQRSQKQQLTQQKRKLRRSQIRSSAEQRFGKKTVDTAVKAGQTAGKVVQFVGHAAAQTVGWVFSAMAWPVLGIAAIFILLLVGILLIGTLIFGSVTSTMTSYTATDEAIEAVSMCATKLEAELEQEIAKIPSAFRWGHIDEFVFNIDTIEHDPYELMGYLTVQYQDFDMSIFSPVPGQIERIHNLRYTLTTNEIRETRTHTITLTNPFTGEKYDIEVPYTYYTLETRLQRSGSVEDVVRQELMASPKGEKWEWYQLLIDSKGSRQRFENPFGDGFDWRSRIAGMYGYRIDPNNGQNIQLHYGLDIAAARGTPIFAGLTGTVRYCGFDPAIGNYVVLEDGSGGVIKYAHCDQLPLSPGDKVVAGVTIVATVGNAGANTGTHLHVEIEQDGKYLDPVYLIYQ